MKSVNIRISDIVTDDRLVQPPFDEGRRAKTREIQRIFAEVFPQSLAEWELSFRKERDPDDQIDHWLRVGEVFERSTEGVTSRAARHDIFAIVFSSVIQHRSAVLKRYPEVLTPTELRPLAAELWPDDREEGVLFKPIRVRRVRS